jgi:hypothetical protein
MSMKSRNKDNLIYLAVGIGVVAALAGYIFYFDSQDRSIPEIPLGPSWLVASTVFLVAGTIQSLRRRHLKLSRHLPLIVGVAVLHPLATAVALHAMARPQLFVLGAACFAEGIILLQVIDRLAARHQKGHD